MTTENSSLIHFPEGKLPEISLIRDVSKHLKRGHRWIFADCFVQKDITEKVPTLFTLKSRDRNVEMFFSFLKLA